jgi:hypothetical protein
MFVRKLHSFASYESPLSLNNLLNSNDNGISMINEDMVISEKFVLIIILVSLEFLGPSFSSILILCNLNLG